MPIYVAMLRGINVGGRKVGMEPLRELFRSLGHLDVATYVQSGNVVFETSERKTSPLTRSLEAALAETFGFDVPVLLRTRVELESVYGENPFLEAGVDPAVLHVTFLADTPDTARVRALSSQEPGVDELVVVGKQVYLACPNGYGRTKLHNAFLEKQLAVTATTRNWRTVGNLLAMMAT